MNNLSPILFSGSSHPALAQEIVSYLNMPLGKINLHFFPDQEISVDILDPVHHRHTYILQSLAFNPNVYLMELLMIIDALKRASAASITVILSYYAYARQDRLDKPGVPITAKLLANLLIKAGTNYLISLDLHSEQIEGFFDIPITPLLSHAILINYCSQLNLGDVVVVAPDKGGIKIASAYAKQLGVPMAMIDKERIDAFRVEMNLFIGHVQGLTVFLPDDMCSTATTLVHAATICARLGAKRIIAIVGHGLFIGNALDSLEYSPIEIVITTNSVPHSEKVRTHPKIRIVSVASLFAQTIDRNNKADYGS